MAQVAVTEDSGLSPAQGAGLWSQAQDASRPACLHPCLGLPHQAHLVAWPLQAPLPQVKFTFKKTLTKYTPLFL